jgi:hypothetical protein
MMAMVVQAVQIFLEITFINLLLKKVPFLGIRKKQFVMVSKKQSKNLKILM